MLSKPWRPNTKTEDKAMFISPHFWNQQVWVNVSGQLKWFKTPEALKLPYTHQAKTLFGPHKQQNTNKFWVF